MNARDAQGAKEPRCTCARGILRYMDGGGLALVKMLNGGPPWRVKKSLIATLDSIATLGAGAFP